MQFLRCGNWYHLWWGWKIMFFTENKGPVILLQFSQQWIERAKSASHKIKIALSSLIYKGFYNHKGICWRVVCKKLKIDHFSQSDTSSLWMTGRSLGKMSKGVCLEWLGRLTPCLWSWHASPYAPSPSGVVITVIKGGALPIYVLILSVVSLSHGHWHQANLIKWYATWSGQYFL